MDLDTVVFFVALRVSLTVRYLYADPHDLFFLRRRYQLAVLGFIQSLIHGVHTLRRSLYLMTGDLVTPIPSA